MFYFEQLGPQGKFRPCLAPEKPTERTPDGARRWIQNVRKLPEAARRVPLNLLHQAMNSSWPATHLHLKTGGLYRVTFEGRLEVTGDDAYPLVEYENADGEKFAQRADRFHDGRFLTLGDGDD